MSWSPLGQAGMCVAEPARSKAASELSYLSRYKLKTLTIRLKSGEGQGAGLLDILAAGSSRVTETMRSECIMNKTFGWTRLTLRACHREGQV